MEKLGVVELSFREYMQSVYGDVALNPLQLREIRKAFFAGVHWGLVEMTNAVLDAGIEIKENDVIAMSIIVNELNSFALSVEKEG